MVSADTTHKDAAAPIVVAHIAEEEIHVPRVVCII
jgi:hypothetical protein